jgi:serine/threonine protein kinase
VSVVEGLYGSPLRPIGPGSTESLRDVNFEGDAPGLRLWSSWMRHASDLSMLLDSADRPTLRPVPPSIPPVDDGIEPYSDGSPVMHFLDGGERVSERVRDVLKAMLSPDPEDRPTASELLYVL